MTQGHYKLWCEDCSAEYADDGWRLQCDHSHAPGLLTVRYAEARFMPDTLDESIYRYQRWLPAGRRVECRGRTVVYQSERLNHLVGLPNLWVAFNGYWPERRAFLETTTFKELEAYSVLGRVPREGHSVLVVASAGNTAAAFAAACSANRVPCLIIIPESGLERMVFPAALNPCVKIVTLSGFTDYLDAIVLAERVAAQPGFVSEGGVKNVARRDGLGTTLLSAVEAIGKLPDYYFQAIGSGSGAIAVFEMAKRLIADGRFGDRVPRLMLSQNLPFIPIYLSWHSRQRKLITFEADTGKRQIQQISARVLSNQRPPYSIRGGVFDALIESDGDMLVADNAEAAEAGRLFEEVEGIDIDAAGAVAFATLMKAARYERVNRRDTVLLNITGGGWRRLAATMPLVAATPALTIDSDGLTAEETLDRIKRLFA